MSERLVGTISRGIRAPIIREGDNIAEIVVDSVINASKSAGFELRDRDVIAVTEAVVARAQGNYATVDDIARDVKEKFGDKTVGVIFPILSRNRFAICLRGMAKGLKKIVLMYINLWDTFIISKKNTLKLMNGLKKQQKYGMSFKCWGTSLKKTKENA